MSYVSFARVMPWCRVVEWYQNKNNARIKCAKVCQCDGPPTLHVHYMSISVQYSLANTRQLAHWITVVGYAAGESQHSQHTRKQTQCQVTRCLGIPLCYPVYCFSGVGPRKWSWSLCTCFFPKASPMLGFSFSHTCREGAIRKWREGGRTGNRRK